MIEGLRSGGPAVWGTIEDLGERQMITDVKLAGKLRFQSGDASGYRAPAALS